MLLVATALLAGSGSALAHAHVPGAGTRDLVGSRVTGNGLCTGASLPADYSGTLTVDGGPLASSVTAHVNLTATYDQEATVTYVGNGTLVSQNCETATSTWETNESGGFAGAIALPYDTCEPAPGGGSWCTVYAAPFAPLSLAPTTLPAGYGLSSAESGSKFALTWVAGLASVSMRPAGPDVAIAPGASRLFDATPRTANGSVSPLLPSFHWSLHGSGFRFASTPVNGSAIVTAPAAGRATELAVNASATVGPNTFFTPVLRLNLTSVATAVVSGRLDRTTVDAGQPVAASVTALGPGGYAYSADFRPGPGLPDRIVPCDTAWAPAGTVTVHCATNVTYSTPGSEVLSVNVTNGYSSANWSSPTLTVRPALALSLRPSVPVGYVGTPIPVELVAANGSGVLPYVRACFDPGIAPVTCSSSAGTAWTFDPTYLGTGNYSGSAWVVDAAGTNRSLSTAVEVVNPLSAGGPITPSASPAAGVRMNLSADVHGGAFPLEVWWNASDLARPIAVEWVGADGRLIVPFVPPLSGTARVEVTIRDALGSEAALNLTLTILPGPVAALLPIPSPPSAPTEVGHPVALGWKAFDSVGELVPTFAASVDLVIERAGGTSAPAWVNLSGFGALSPSPEGSFAVPSTDWSDGSLYVNVTPAVAGALTVLLEGPPLPGNGANSSASFLVTPDLTQLRLYSPLVALPGPGTNHTFWYVADRYGDPVPGAYLTLQYLDGGVVRDSFVPVEWSGPNATGAWVNYSFPSGSGGSLRLLDAAGDVLLGPVALATPGDGSFGGGVALFAVLLALAAVVGLGGALAVRPRRRPTLDLPPSEEEAARRLVEGRAEVVEAVRRSGTADRDAIAATWARPGPPTDLDDWLASLVADGTLRTVPDPEGRSTYALAPSAPEGPRVTVDEETLARAVRAREAAVRDDAPGEGP